MDRGQVPGYDGCRPNGSIGPNSIAERDRVRRYLANRVCGEYRHPEQEWMAKEDLALFVDMLGLWPKWDEAAESSVRRASVRDCSPVAESIQVRRARNQNRKVG